jgi:hypothetical protein
MEEKQSYQKCERYGKAIAKEEYETYDGLCEECYGQKAFSKINYHILSLKLHTNKKWEMLYTVIIPGSLSDADVTFTRISDVCKQFSDLQLS